GEQESLFEHINEQCLYLCHSGLSVPAVRDALEYFGPERNLLDSHKCCKMTNESGSPVGPEPLLRVMGSGGTRRTHAFSVSFVLRETGFPTNFRLRSGERLKTGYRPAEDQRVHIVRSLIGVDGLEVDHVP